MNCTSGCSNSTFVGPDWFDYLVNSVTIVEGVLSFVGNSMVLYTIFTHVAFRSRPEYIVLAGLALADGVTHGIGVVVEAVTLMFFMDDISMMNLTPWQFSLLPYMINQMLMNTSFLMLAALSFDRLLITMKPMWYISQGAKLGYSIVGFVFGYTFVLAFIAYVTGYFYLNSEPLEGVGERYIFAGDVLLPGLFGAYFVSMQIGLLGSILLFLGVLGITYYRNRKYTTGIEQFIDKHKISQQALIFLLCVAASNTSGVPQAAANLQKMMTIKAAYSTTATFMLVIVPSTLVLVLLDDKEDRYWYNLMFLVPGLNPVFNVWIFLFRHPTMLHGFKAALKRKTMPINLKDWQTTQTTGG